MNLILILIGSVFIFDTVFIMCRSNINMGVLLPALLGMPILVYGIFYSDLTLWFSVGIGRYVGFAIILCYVLFILLILICIILIYKAAKKDPPQNADVIIVLGAAVQGTKLSKALKNRLDVALGYWRKYEQGLIVVSGGKGMQESISEAEAMCKYLLLNGVPEEKIIMEDRATSTYENFKFSKEILSNIFPEKPMVIFVTNDFHIYRSMCAAKAAEIDAVGIGCKSPWYIAPNYYMRESLAILRYMLIGIR